MSDTVLTGAEAFQNAPGDEGLVEQRLRHHWTMLGICLAVVLASFALQVRPDQRVEFRWLAGHPLPETCLSRSYLNVPCPGCGLTRSFISLSRGEWSLAYRQNRSGWLLAFAVLLQFPYRFRRIRQLKRDGLAGSEQPAWTSLFSWFLIAALVGNWTLKLFGI